MVEIKLGSRTTVSVPYDVFRRILVSSQFSLEELKKHEGKLPTIDLDALKTISQLRSLDSRLI